MKRKMVSVLILALLNLWIPYASAEISQDLDPMVSPEAQATVTSESPADSTDVSLTGDAVSPAGTVASDKKVEETKQEKNKKSLGEKSEGKKKEKAGEKKKEKAGDKKKKKSDEKKKKKSGEKKKSDGKKQEGKKKKTSTQDAEEKKVSSN